MRITNIYSMLLSGSCYVYKAVLNFNSTKCSESQSIYHNLIKNHKNNTYMSECQPNARNMKYRPDPHDHPLK